MNILKKPISILMLSIASSFFCAFGEMYHFSANVFKSLEPSIVLSLLVILFYFLYDKYLFSKANGYIWFISVFTALNFVLYSIIQYDLNHIFSKITILKSVYLVCMLSIYTLLFKCIFYGLSLKLKALLTSVTVKKHTLTYFIVLSLIATLPHAFFLFPGTIQWDNGTMLQIAYGLKPLSNNNPLFSIGLMYCVRFLTNFFSPTFSVFAYVLIQHLIQAILLGLILIRIQEINSKLCMPTIIFYAIIPAFGHYASSLGKDLPFALIITYMSLLMYDVIQNKQNQTAKKIFFKFLTSSLLIIFSRNIGIYLLGVLIPFIIYMLYKNKKIALGLLCSIGIAIIISLLTLNVLNHKLQLEPEKKAANKSISLQFISMLYIEDKNLIGDEDLRKIDAVLPIANIEENFILGYSDHIKDSFNEQATSNDIAQFNKTVNSYIKKHPLLFIKSIFSNAYAYYIPGIYTHLKPDYFFDSHYIEDIDSFNLIHFEGLKRVYRFGISLIKRLPLLHIVNSCGFIFYVQMLSLIYVLFKRKYIYILPLLPSFIYSLGLMASPVNGYYRYCLPSLYGLFINLIVAITIYSDTIDFKNENAKMLHKN